MAEYLTYEPLRPEQEHLARYYAGEIPPARSAVDDKSQQLSEGRVGFEDALAHLVEAEKAAKRGRISTWKPPRIGCATPQTGRKASRGLSPSFGPICRRHSLLVLGSTINASR